MTTRLRLGVLVADCRPRPRGLLEQRRDGRARVPARRGISARRGIRARRIGARGGSLQRRDRLRHRGTDQGLRVPHGPQRRRRPVDHLDQRRQRQPHGDPRRRVVRHAGRRREDGDGHLQHAGDVRLPLQDPPEHDRVARGQVAPGGRRPRVRRAGRRSPSRPTAGRSATALGRPRVGEPAERLAAADQPRALDQLVELDARRSARRGASGARPGRSAGTSRARAASRPAAARPRRTG